MRDGQMAFADVGMATARLSDDGVYRYELGRRWARGPAVLFVMLNPSTADATTDDQTIRRCIGYARSWDMGALGVVNLFALRATDPAELRRADDPVGPLNDDVIHDAIVQSRFIVAAWGAHPFAAERARFVADAADGASRTLACLKMTKGGHPSHPSRLKSGLRPVPWP